MKTPDSGLPGIILGLLISLPVAAPAALDTPIPESLLTAPQHVREAVLRYGETDLEQWHYRRSRTTEEGTIVDRHDPTLPGPEHWQLITIDGREPTGDEFAEFEDDRADHSDEEERARSEFVIDIIEPGSITLLEEIDGAQRYGFQLRSPDGKREKVYLGLSGDLLIQPGDDGPWVRNVRVWNTETLRPVIGVRIDEIMVSFQFDLQDENVVPVGIEANWNGAFLMLKDIEREVSVSLSDFRRAQPPGNPDGASTPE